MYRTSASLFVFAYLLAGCAPRVPEASFERTPYLVRIEAGAYDRLNTPASFAWPADLERGPFVLQGNGETVPVQLDNNGLAWLIVASLPAGEARTYRLFRSDSAGTWDVDAQTYGAAVSFRVDDRPVFQYHADETILPRTDIDPIYRRGGYVHPVLTPSGKLISDDYPPNHVHHHGIWAAWTETAFQGRTPDFWNMGEETGTVRPVALDHVWEGPVHGGLQARNQYVDLSDPAQQPVLDEVWRMQVFDTHEGGDPYWLFDLELTQTTATDSALHLPRYRYGGVGFRGHRSWNGADSTFFLTSAGWDRTNGHATRARWTHVGGYVDGELAGVAILGHPGNFRAPQPVRIHPTEPFFNYAPSQAGDFAIRPGEPYVARYRFVVSDGPPEAEEIDRLWNDYAHPPVVTVTRE